MVFLLEALLADIIFFCGSGGSGGGDGGRGGRGEWCVLCVLGGEGKKSQGPGRLFFVSTPAKNI